MPSDAKFFAIGEPVFAVRTTSADISSAFSSTTSLILSSLESSSSALRPLVPTPCEPVDERLLRGVLVGGVLLAPSVIASSTWPMTKRLQLGRDAVDANEYRGDAPSSFAKNAFGSDQPFRVEVGRGTPDVHVTVGEAEVDRVEHGVLGRLGQIDL